MYINNMNSAHKIHKSWRQLKRDSDKLALKWKRKGNKMRQINGNATVTNGHVNDEFPFCTKWNIESNLVEHYYQQSFSSIHSVARLQKK